MDNHLQKMEVEQVLWDNSGFNNWSYIDLSTACTRPRLGLDFYSLLWRVAGIVIFITGIFILRLADKEFHKMGIRPDTITSKLVTTGIYIE